MEVINWKKNKEVSTICFEVRVPMKKQKIFMEFNKFILEENKNIYGNILIPLKSHWKIGLM